MLTKYHDFCSQIIDLSGIFNNRELALMVWIFIVAIYLLSNKKARIPLLNIVQILFCKKFILAYFCMLFYVGLTVYLLYLMGFWNITLLKDTVIWFLFTGIISAFRVIDKAKDFSYFKAVIKDYIKITLLLEFTVNLYTFSFISELILIPFMAIIAIFGAFLDICPEYQNKKSEPIKKLFWFINIVMGLYIILHAIILAINDIENLESISTLQSLLLPPLLSTAFLVFIYFFALWSSYEQIFIRIPFGENKSKSLIAYVKFKIVLLCKLNINRVNNFWKICGLEVLNIKCKADAIKISNNYKNM